jgi:hypothetical protein
MSQIKLSEIKARRKQVDIIYESRAKFPHLLPGPSQIDRDNEYLLELVKRMGKMLEQVRDVTGHTYDCPEGLTEARVLRHISTATQPCSELCKEARALLKELEL